MKYDYLVVGSGLFGATFAHEAKAAGKSVLVIDKRPNIAGNVYTEDVEGIHVHRYGAHIFHTNDKKVWDYVNRFAVFNRFTNSPVANYRGELYSLPFNMYTFNKMWGVVTPQEAAAKIEEQKKDYIAKKLQERGLPADAPFEPQNLEEQAISLIGTDIYEKLIKGYTEKQWGRPCTELPSFIIKRLPVRLTFDNNYFNALYQGIPVGGYTKMVEKMLDGIEVRLNEDYLKDRENWNQLAEKVIFTGPIDAYYDYRLGTLIIRTGRRRGLASLSISGLNLAKMQTETIFRRQWYLVSILPSGSREMSLTIRSMMERMGHYIRNTKNWRIKRAK